MGALPPASGRYSVVDVSHLWQVACLSSELRRDRPLARTVQGLPIALFRAAGAGAPQALADRCPHRNAPLSLGRIRDGMLECRYHGWCFDGAGACRSVPGLYEGATAGTSATNGRPRDASALATAEQDGFVWVLAAPDPARPAPERPPRFPLVEEPGYATVRRRFVVAGTLHAALENALDVPHTAFLHRGLFRGGRAPVPIDVIVRHRAGAVEAEYLGEPRPQGLAGRLLAPEGGVVSHVDRFVAPSLAQVEYRLGANHLVVTTAFTPVGDHETAGHSAITFKLRVATPLVRAAVGPVAQRILAQDAMILEGQSATIRAFGGEQFASTRLDTLGSHIGRMLRRLERGQAGEGDDGDPPQESRFTIRV